MADGEETASTTLPQDRRASEMAAWIAGDSSGRFTLRRLQVFWTVAHFSSLTKAAKQLGLTQPTLSQQIASLEEIVGTALFARLSNRLVLTEAGRHLLRKTEIVLDGIQSLEDSVVEIGQGLRQTMAIAGLNSVLRVVLPKAMEAMRAAYPSVDYDIHESTPADVVEMLYGRRISIGLIATNSIAPASAGFRQVPICTDPYVLAVPESLHLDGVSDPKRDLPQSAHRLLCRSIQFMFGTQHTQRVQDWYDQHIPGNWPFARVRSFEVALGLVRAGEGVCLAPSMSCVVGGAAIDGVTLYRVAQPPREIAALLSNRHATQEPYATLVAALSEAGSGYAPPPMRKTPPFLAE
ncbi:MAG: LysR family transcriptional regulator [Rhodobacteraceae bacterium]|nr:LysR family transcriptional regulator [Paracoccaceae bacterium]